MSTRPGDGELNATTVNNRDEKCSKAEMMRRVIIAWNAWYLVKFEEETTDLN